MMKKAVILLITVIYCSIYANCLSCDDFASNKFGENENEVENGNVELGDVLKCLSEIANNPNTLEQSQNVWNSLKVIYGGADQVPKDCLIKMGWVLKGISAFDIANITIDDIDMVEAFGVNRDMNTDQMYAVADRIRNDWAQKKPQHYSHFDLMALNQILCFLESREIDKIHPDAYKYAAKRIGELESCSSTVLQRFAKLAVDSSAFGPPNKWSKFDIECIGIVVMGLQPNEIAAIPEEHQKYVKRNRDAIAANRN